MFYTHSQRQILLAYSISLLSTNHCRPTDYSNYTKHRYYTYTLRRPTYYRKLDENHIPQPLAIFLPSRHQAQRSPQMN